MQMNALFPLTLNLRERETRTPSRDESGHFHSGLSN
jgi:hypothetical protein